jgi:hypothetical protein
MPDRFPTDQLDVERLLADWRWLCPQNLTLIARSVYGDLFLQDHEGRVFWLDVAVGRFTEVADSEKEFLERANAPEAREEWFGESDERSGAEKGLIPGPGECIGFSVPLALAEGGSSDTPYIADLYEHISFLGDLHRQIANLPDGTKVQLKVRR